MHPQQSIHAQSLLFPPEGSRISKEEEAVLTLPANFNPAKAVGALSAQAFWLQAASAIDWVQQPSVAYGRGSDGEDEWFPDGTLNTTYNCLDRHVEAGRGHHACFHYECAYRSQVKEAARTYTYSDVLLKVQLLAAVLTNTLGVGKGDRVIIYASMIPEAAFAMLACARIGAVHSVVFGGFSAKELAKRIDDAEPKAMLATSCGIEPKGVLDYRPIIQEALKLSKQAPKSLLLFDRVEITGHKSVSFNSGNTKVFNWQKECDDYHRKKGKLPGCTPVKSSDLLYTLYTSGTTGAPKGVVRTNGGHAVSTLYCMQNTFGQNQNDVFFCASDVGWVVGHEFIVYAPLFLGCASIFFEGKPIIPDAGVWWRIVEKYKVTGLFTAPTALRALRKEDGEAKFLQKHNIKSLRTLFLAGERSEPQIVELYDQFLRKYAGPNCSVLDHFWQTESGNPVIGRMLSPAFSAVKSRPGSAGHALPGMDIHVYDDEGKPVKAGVMGNIVIKKPLAPSFATTLWRNPKRFQTAYFDRFEGCYDTGDAGLIDEDGYIHVLSRTDDVINVAAHRISTSTLEQVIVSHDLISEACVVGAPDAMKGTVPFALATLATAKIPSEKEFVEVLKEINKHVRQEVGAIASIGHLVIGRLPKTRSGKTLRRSVREVVEAAAQEKYDFEPLYPPTIEDVGVLKESTRVIQAYFKARADQPKSKL